MAKKNPINMRVGDRQHALLTKAAETLNIDRTAFILDVACREAENILLDQRLFQLDEDAFQAFDNALNQPVKTSKVIKALLKESSPWEQ